MQVAGKHSQKYWWMRLFSAKIEQYASKEECNKQLNEDGTFT